MNQYSSTVIISDGEAVQVQFICIEIGTLTDGVVGLPVPKQSARELGCEWRSFGHSACVTFGGFHFERRPHARGEKFFALFGRGCDTRLRHVCELPGG